MINKTTTVRISDKTREILRKLKQKKQMTMSSIIYNLAENELKRIYKIGEIVDDENNM